MQACLLSVSAPALQHCNVLLASHCAGVVVVDNFHAGASISRQRNQVNPLPIKQAEGDGAVTQAVKAAGVAVRVEF